MPFTYPVFLEIADQPCVVIGGGPETLRKVVPLVEQGALVKLITPDPPPGLDELAARHPGRITVLHRDYAEGDLAGAFLCISASGDHELNGRIFAEGRRCGVLVNSVDDIDHCRFATPALLRRGDLVIAVGTGGRAPAMARRIRRELAERYGPEYGEATALVGDVRAETRTLWSSFDGWAERWRTALDDEVIRLVVQGRRDAARALLRERLSRPGHEPGAPPAPGAGPNEVAEG